MNTLEIAKKNTLTLILTLITFQSYSQSDALQDMSAEKWQLDLDYLVDVTTSEFALFTTESKQRFTTSATKLRSQLPHLTSNNSIIEISRLMALLNEGHTELKLFGSDLGFQRLPLILYYFGKDLRIVASSKEYKSLLGAKVISIGNSTIEETHKKIAPLISGDNEIENYYRVPQHIIIPEILNELRIINDPSFVEFTVSLIDGTEQNISISSDSIKVYSKIDFVHIRNEQSPPLYRQNTNDRNVRHWFKYLDNQKVMYYRIFGFGDRKGYLTLKKKTKQVFKEMDEVQAKKLVIDLRSNGGGNYELGLSIVENILKRPEIMKNGNLYVIINRATFSAAGYIAALLKKDCNAIVIGEKSSDNPNGADNYERHTLPHSKLIFGVADRTKTNFPEITKPYLSLDIEFEFEFNDYVEGYDPVINYIFEN